MKKNTLPTGGRPSKPVVNILPIENKSSLVIVQWTQPPFSAACDVAFGTDKNKLPNVSVSTSGLWNIPKADIKPETDYFVRVRGFNKFEDGEWSDVVKFRLPKEKEVDPAPPVVPPPTKAIQNITNFSIKWYDMVGVVLILFGLDQYRNHGYVRFGTDIMIVGSIILVAGNTSLCRLLKKFWLWINKPIPKCFLLSAKRIILTTLVTLAVCCLALLLWSKLWSKWPWVGADNLVKRTGLYTPVVSLTTNTNVVALITASNNGTAVGFNYGTINEAKETPSVIYVTNSVIEKTTQRLVEKPESNWPCQKVPDMSYNLVPGINNILIPPGADYVFYPPPAWQGVFDTYPLMIGGNPDSIYIAINGKRWDRQKNNCDIPVIHQYRYWNRSSEYTRMRIRVVPKYR